MPRFNWVLTALTVLGLGAALSNEASAQVLDWPLLYDTTVVHHLNLSTMAATDSTCLGPEDPTTWAEIQQDTTTLVEHPSLPGFHPLTGLRALSETIEHRLSRHGYTPAIARQGTVPGSRRSRRVARTRFPQRLRILLEV